MNKFDQLAGLADYDESLGFLKKIKKAAKKVVKTAVKPVKAVVKPVVKATKSVTKEVVRAHENVANKLIVKPIESGLKAASPLMANPMVKAAVVGTAIGVGAGPLVIAGLQTAGSLAEQREAAKAANAQYAQEVADPEYIAAVQQMQADGMTPQQIQAEWMQSQAYRQAAVPAVAAQITPFYQQQYQAAGVQNYQEVGATVAARDAVRAVDEVQKKFSYEQFLIPGAVAVAALLILTRR